MAGSTNKAMGLVKSRTHTMIKKRGQRAMALAEEVILETHSLVKDFNGFLAVDGVSVRVKQGEIHALIGPNGAGKTTFFNLLTKFLQPTSGTIFYRGENITREKPADIAPTIADFIAYAGPAFLEVVIDPDAGVYPMIGPGMSYAQMVTGDHIASRQVVLTRAAEASEMF